MIFFLVILMQKCVVLFHYFYIVVVSKLILGDIKNHFNISRLFKECRFLLIYFLKKNLTMIQQIKQGKMWKEQA